jgi:NADPH-dependent curcumin reductase CurA/predicted MFS family arabinose efflux permease
LSRRAGFWAVAFAFTAVTAFSTTPSPLYGLYERQLGLSSLTITLVYAVYALGVVGSLLIAGHVSDWYGRRAVLIPAITLAAVAALVFIAWQSVAGLLVARLLTGVALGASVATAAAYIGDLDGAGDGAPTRRAGIVTTMASVGGIGVGPLVSGFLARYAHQGLTLPYVVVLASLVAGVAAVTVAPEGHAPIHPRPRYRPQRLRAPATGRGRFLAAVAGVFLAFSAGGLVAGLTGTLLAGPLHHPSSALAGLAIFLAFASGVVAQTTTMDWPLRRLVVTGIATLIVGLAVLVTSAWVASLALFLIGGAVAGAGVGGIFRASLGIVISTSGPQDRAAALAMFFVAGYAGVSLPVLGIGVALQFLSPQITLLAFGIAVGAGILAAAPVLVRVEYLSIDPAMRRGIAATGAYSEPAAIGAVIEAGAIGRVTTSEHPGFAVGEHVYGGFGVRELATSDGTGVTKVDPALAPLTAYLGALGIPGLTAYFGSLAGQIARIKGCRVIGIAGGAEKARWIVDELGFDAAVDYKAEDVGHRLGELAPAGVDVFVDNVGGETLDAVLGHLARGARVVLSDGRLISREQIVDGGVAAFPDALHKLFAGENTGKLVLAVAP